MSLKLNSSGGGSVTLQEPVTASTLTLNLPSTSGTMVLDGGSPTFAAVTSTALTVNGNNISAVNSMGFRNRIINGDMRIDQRNAGASVTPAALEYQIDRWRYFASQASKITMGQNQGGVTPPVGFTNYLGLTSSSAYSVLTTDFFGYQQFIEGLNASDLAWGTANAQAVTLSFWVRSSLTGTFGGSIQNSGTNRSYPFSYTISVANTWEQKTVTIPGDTSGTWLTTNGRGIAVNLMIGVGSNNSGTAGAWAASDFRSATGAVSVVGTNGATFYITGVQLEAGTVATPFERRPYGTELALCQRYFYKIDANGSTLSFASGWFASTTSARVSIPIPTTLRATPTLTATLTDAIRGAAGSFTPSASNVDKLLPNCVALSFTVSGGTANRSCAFVGAGAITLSSEL